MEADGLASHAISGAFPMLRRLAQSFEALDRALPADRRELFRAAARLGATALPLCRRHFAGADEDRARWAHALLAHLARDPGLKTRIVGELGAMVRAGGLPDLAVMRAIALLAELGAEPPEDAALSDPDEARRRSSRDLALCLGTPAEVARAGDHLLDNLSGGQMLDLFDDLIDTEPGAAIVLLDELLVRDELDEGLRHELRQRRAVARQLAPAAAPLRSRRRQRIAPACRAGYHADGRRILLAEGRQPGSRPPRLRVFCALIGPGGPDGILLDGHYGEDLSDEAIQIEFVAPLERQGFVFAGVTPGVARAILIQAARLAVQAGRALPRPFYLGRHMLGLRDEHLDGTARDPAGVDLAALLDRAIVLVAAGEPAQALPLLERYVTEAPGDAEGHAQLGLCRLGLGDPAAALAHLSRATALAPDEPLHHWNSAAAAHRAGLMGACYLELEAYCAARDVAPGADERRRTAEVFSGEYARLAALEHPGTSPHAVATAETPGPRRWRPRRQRG
jgi:tetratricopeptide (TPR) repeat protein